MTSRTYYFFVAKTLKIRTIGLLASKVGPRAPKVSKKRDFDLPKSLKIMSFTSQKMIKKSIIWAPEWPQTPRNAVWTESISVCFISVVSLLKPTRKKRTIYVIFEKKLKSELSSPNSFFLKIVKSTVLSQIFELNDEQDGFRKQETYSIHPNGSERLI